MWQVLVRTTVICLSFLSAPQAIRRSPAARIAPPSFSPPARAHEVHSHHLKMVHETNSPDAKADPQPGRRENQYAAKNSFQNSSSTPSALSLVRENAKEFSSSKFKSTDTRPESQKFSKLITEALYNPQVSNNLSIEHLLLLEALQRENSPGPCRDFFEYMVKNHLPTHVRSRRNTCKFWSSLLDSSFIEFSQDHKEQAQSIVNFFIIPKHPFGSELSAEPSGIEEFLSRERASLDELFTSTVHRIFNAKMTEILSSTDPLYDPEAELVSLIKKYKKSKSWKDPQLKYVCCFLIAVKFQHFKRIALKLATQGYDFYQNITQLAHTIYHSTSEKAAQRLLRQVLPSVYQKTLAQNSYQLVMDAYVKSGVELLDPQELRDLAAQALEVHEAPSSFSDIYTSILEGFSRETSFLHHYLTFICTNYPLPCSQNRKGSQIPWKSLISNSLQKYYRAHKKQAEMLLNSFFLQYYPFNVKDFSESLEISEFFLQKSPAPLHEFLGETFGQILARKLSFIFEETEGDTAKWRFRAFFRECKQKIPPRYRECKYAVAFLMNVEFQEILKLKTLILGQGFYSYNFISQIASTVYHQLGHELAQQALRSVLDSVYDQTPSTKSYNRMTRAYAESGLEPEDPEDFRSSIMESLQDHMTAGLSPGCKSFLEAFAADMEPSRAFFDFVLRHYKQCQMFKLQSPPHVSWVILLDISFGQFLCAHPDKAQYTFQKIVIATHPFLSQAPGYQLSIEEFKNDPHFSLELFLDTTVKSLFAQRLTKIFTTKDLSYGTQREFHLLLHNYKDAMSFQDARIKYSCTFLMKAGLKYARLTAMPLIAENYEFYTDMNRFAESVYDKMSFEKTCGLQGALQALENVLPSVFRATTEKNYRAVLKAYVESSVEPADPEKIRQFIKTTLQAPNASSYLSPFHISFLETLLQESGPYRGLFDYIFHNYPLQSIWSRSDALYRLSFLLNTCFGRFAKLHPEQAQQIVESIIVPSYHPLLPQSSVLRFDISIFTISAEYNYLSLDKFFRPAIGQAFNEKWREIFTNPATSYAETQSAFRSLLQKYKKVMSWQDPELKYHCVFVMNARFDHIEILSAALLIQEYDFCNYMRQFALIVYLEIKAVSPNECQETLKSVLPCVYNQTSSKGYQSMIRTYVQSGKEPIVTEIPKTL